MARKIKIRGRKKDHRIYDSDGSYELVRDNVWRDFQSYSDERLAADGISRTQDGYYYYTEPFTAGAPDWSETDLFDINRGVLGAARRDRRRVYVPQDDRRFKVPNIEDFNHVPERVYHDEKGQVQEVRQQDMPRNVNVGPSSNRIRKYRFVNREVIDRLRASICGKRKQRREVLFATRKTGKGANKRRHLWTQVSKIICK